MPTSHLGGNVDDRCFEGVAGSCLDHGLGQYTMPSRSQEWSVVGCDPKLYWDSQGCRESSPWKEWTSNLQGQLQKPWLEGVYP